MPKHAQCARFEGKPPPPMLGAWIFGGGLGVIRTTWEFSFLRGREDIHTHTQDPRSPQPSPEFVQARMALAHCHSETVESLGRHTTAIKITTSGSKQLSQQQRTTALGRLHQATLARILPRAAAATSGAGSPPRTCAGPNKRQHWAGSPTAQQLASPEMISPSAPHQI